MRRIDPGRTAGTAVDGSGRPPADPPARTVPIRALASGTADHLAALAAQAAHAPGALIYFRADDRLVLYGGWGSVVDWADLTDIPVDGTVTGQVVLTGAPVIIGDVSADDRIPASSPVRAGRLRGSYLAQPIVADDGRVIGVCSALDPVARVWTPAEVTAMAEAAKVSTLLITEQLARHELDRQARFLDAVLDSLHDGVTACDADGRIVLLNRRMRQLWGDAPVPAGLKDDAAVDGLFDSQGNPIRRDETALFRALRGEALRDEGLVLRGRTRRTRHYLVDAQPIRGADGRLLGAVQAVQDVTRRRRVDRFQTCELAVTTALAEARTVEQAGPRVLAAIGRTLDWAHAELWLVDDTAEVLRAAAQWSAPGYHERIDLPGELAYGQGLAGRSWQVGKPLWIRDVGQPQSLISPQMATASCLHTALAVPVKHGAEVLGVLCVFTDAIEDPEGEVVALLSVVAAHIAQFVDRRMVEDLQRQLVRSKNEYLALIGHELRTPLTSISAYTELLREADPETLAGDGARLLEVIDRNAVQLRHIIDELLELSALDTGHAAVQLTPVDLAQVVRESVEAARAAIDGEPLSIATDLPDELVLPADRKRLRQVVDNLLGNAVRYSSDHSTIEVSLHRDGRSAELSVSDTGIGVSPEEREKLFTGHFRTARARDKVLPGTGLGLTLSRAVVEHHHGTIELIDHEGKGTTIVMRLLTESR